MTMRCGNASQGFSARWTPDSSGMYTKPRTVIAIFTVAMLIEGVRVKVAHMDRATRSISARAVLIPRVIGHHRAPGPRERISFAFPRGEGAPASPPGGSNREPSGRRCSLPIGFRRLRPTTILPLLCVGSHATTLICFLPFYSSPRD